MTRLACLLLPLSAFLAACNSAPPRQRPPDFVLDFDFTDPGRDFATHLTLSADSSVYTERYQGIENRHRLRVSAGAMDELYRYLYDSLAFHTITAARDPNFRSAGGYRVAFAWGGREQHRITERGDSVVTSAGRKAWRQLVPFLVDFPTRFLQEDSASLHLAWSNELSGRRAALEVYLNARRVFSGTIGAGTVPPDLSELRLRALPGIYRLRVYLSAFQPPLAAAATPSPPEKKAFLKELTVASGLTRYRVLLSPDSLRLEPQPSVAVGLGAAGE